VWQREVQWLPTKKFRLGSCGFESATCIEADIVSHDFRPSAASMLREERVSRGGAKIANP
jgi:hypothetical protein